MKKIKEWIKKHEKIINTVLDILLGLVIFLGGIIVGLVIAEYNYTASAEEIDLVEESDERDEVQPPSLFFQAVYENGISIPFYLITPSVGNSTSYAGQWGLDEDFYGVSGYLYNSVINGLQGNISLQYDGINSAMFPTYKFTFSNIYTHFTDQFQWGYIEVTGGQTNITYEFEIYDFRNKEIDYITYNMVLNEPTYSINIDPTAVLNTWGFSQDPIVNPFQYYVSVGSGVTATELAYIRSYTISFSSTTLDEQFYIGYTGNINADIVNYMNAMQIYGESKVPPTEIDGLFVFNSIIDAVDRFMSIEILPNFSFYDILYIALGIPLTIWLLKLWLGG